MTSAQYQNCDDFSSAMTEPKDAYFVAHALGYECTFEFNRAHQGATHAISGQPCKYPENEHYAKGYLAGIDAMIE